VTTRIRAPILVFSCENAAIASGPWCLLGLYRSSPCVAPSRGIAESSFAFGQVRRLDGLADVESIF
jgi:hypothetical protein